MTNVLKLVQIWQFQHKNGKNINLCMRRVYFFTFLGPCHSVFSDLRLKPYPIAPYWIHLTLGLTWFQRFCSDLPAPLSQETTFFHLWFKRGGGWLQPGGGALPKKYVTGMCGHIDPHFQTACHWMTPFYFSHFALT